MDNQVRECSESSIEFLSNTIIQIVHCINYVDRMVIVENCRKMNGLVNVNSGGKEIYAIIVSFDGKTIQSFD